MGIESYLHGIEESQVGPRPGCDVFLADGRRGLDGGSVATKR